MTAVLTAVLIGVTARYVVLTRRMLEANEASVRAGFMPDIEANVEFTHPRKDELALHIKNSAESPLCVLRARLVGGSVFKWPETPGNGPLFTAEVKLGATEISTLVKVFLRKGEEATGAFKILPADRTAAEEWPKFLDYRISLSATAVIEVSDITGRILYSFTVRRDANRGGITNIQTQYRGPKGKSFPDAPKPDAGVTVARHDPDTKRHASDPGVEAPRTAAQRSMLAALCPGWIALRAGRIIPIRVRNPLRHVPQHIVQPKGVR